MLKMQNGLTLIELLTVLAIVTIMMVIGGVGFNSYFKDKRIQGLSNHFIAALNFTRNEALQRNVPVTICIRNSAGDNCDSLATNWSNGWLVFTDTGTIGSLAGTDQSLWLTDPFASTITASSSGFGNGYYVQYDATGKSHASGSFSICDNRTGEIGRLVQINSLGQISIVEVVCP